MKDLIKELKNGKIIHFDNEEFCELFEKDDFRGGTIQIREGFGTINFITWFNGVVNHSSKGWPSSEKNLNRLCKKFGCKVTKINNDMD